MISIAALKPSGRGHPWRGMSSLSPDRWSIRKFAWTAHRYRTIVIQSGQRTIHRQPLPMKCARPANTSTVIQVRTNLSKVKLRARGTHPSTRDAARLSTVHQAESTRSTTVLLSTRAENVCSGMATRAYSVAGHMSGERFKERK